MKLIVVTDIFSYPEAAHCSSEKLRPLIDVERFSLSELCGCRQLSGEDLHQHLFMDGGIDIAAQSLLEVAESPCIGLGYSAGGTALWKAAARGMSLNFLFCISSTRLRYETKNSATNHVFFGGLDANRPSQEWLLTVPDKSTVLKNAEHNFYRELNPVLEQELCKEISDPSF